MNQDAHADRVERERHAHEEDDVLGRSLKLKRKFSHVSASPTMRRMNSDMEAILRDVTGKNVLEVGCGYGELSISLSEKGANVLGIDISSAYIEMARRKASDAGLGSSCNFEVMDAHRMNLPDCCMDIVTGRAILHHLSMDAALSEIRRVLRPGGRMVFMEPLSANPLLKLFRLLTPHARTVDERPLTIKDLRKMERLWSVESSYYGLISAPIAMLTSMLIPGNPDNLFLRAADRSELLIKNWHLCKPFNQYVLLNLVRPE